VGNPYQAYLDLDAIAGYSYSSQVKEFYIYDAELNVYAPYYKASSSNPRIPSQYIHPHQGFFVLFKTDNVSGVETFTFTTSMATTTKQSGSYLREDMPNYPLVNLYAENAAGQRDIAIIEFHRPELGGAPKLDALRMANFKIAAHMEHQNFSLLFAPEGTERVPVRFETEEDGVFTLRWETYNGIFSKLFLIDNKMGVTYDMLANDSYTFEASVEDYVSRFAIVFECTDIDENGTTVAPTTFAFFDGSEWVVNGKGQLDVVDVLGRVLYSTELAGDQSRVNLNRCARGVYLLRLTDGDSVRTQKIVVR
jgi:hypothetical protein